MNIVQLQGVIIIYTISSVMSKKASACNGDVLRFAFFFGMEFVILGIYALLWQQMIKRFETLVFGILQRFGLDIKDCGDGGLLRERTDFAHMEMTHVAKTDNTDLNRHTLYLLK